MVTEGTYNVVISSQPFFGVWAMYNDSDTRPTGNRTTSRKCTVLSATWGEHCLGPGDGGRE